MNTAELKSNFHSLIDNFPSESVLAKFYALMVKAKVSGKGQLWNSLTLEQQEELITSDLESLDQNNLIANEEMKKKHKTWL